MTRVRQPTTRVCQHDGRVQFDDSFLGADLHEETDPPRSLDEAFDGLERVSPELSSAGWSCRFYSRLSPADRIYLGAALEVEVAVGDERLLAVCREFFPRISLFLFRTETEGMCEFILIPWEGARVTPAAMVAAANDVLMHLVDVVAWDPHDELRRFSDSV
jgi:hypothetical protein